ncbi:MAG: sarcosine oxidase subunit alpha family protein [Gammaproteobacteria bacterium]|nr:MAG: sarcosine oxidase subunit alpha family protein [Gammaproteobacteria bacterium]
MASQPNRLSSGGRIDRGQRLSFSFNGKQLEGYQGDTIASALLANGISTVNRSFKYHRRRGIMSAGVEETNALLTAFDGTGDVPVVRATVRALGDDHRLRSPSGFPSASFDFGRVLDFTHGLWTAGFYNKLFKWPSWRWYEGAVRRMAGLGKVPGGEDANKYFHHNRHCDVLIVGAGPAGLAAALCSANSGARVLLVEQDKELGGSLLANGAEINGVDSDLWLSQSRSALEEAANVTVMTSATVSGYYDHQVLTITDRSTAGVKRFWKIRAKEVVLATGAIEQPLVFENNDRPGIMLANAAMTYVLRYAVKPANVMVVATNNDSSYQVAFTLHDNGIRVPAIVDVRKKIASEIAQEANQRGIPIMTRSVVLDTVGTKALSKVSVGMISDDGQSVTAASVVVCDGLAISGGFNPECSLYSQAGGKLEYDDALACFVPDSANACRQRVTVVGAADGKFSLAQALAQGAYAGSEAASEAGFSSSPIDISTSVLDSYNVNPLRITPAGNTSRQWIDFAHDVTVADIELAVRENFVSVEHVKRYTTSGMAVDQGKTSNLNTLSLLAELTNRSIAEVGTTTFRPPYMPVPMGAIAGQRHGACYMPARLLPAHDWHASHDAVFENYGAWKRPEYYAIDGRDRETAIHDEALALRKSAGLFDGSPLGKIELKGPDAGEFLHRIYVNNVLTLKTGRIRYGLMLSENGIVIDDGVFARLADDWYLVCTTTANADHIIGWLEQWHQCEWPDLDVIISPVTSQWAVATVAGPNARILLQEIDSNIDFSGEALPHMTLATGTFLGVPARVQRVSFTGEMSFEISVPAKHGEHVMETLMSTGGERLALIGIEALTVLRTEKGYLHVGADTDGMTNALDVGFGGIVNRKKTDFVGKRSLLRAEDQRGDRRQLVGVEPLSIDERLEAGAHFVTSQGQGRRSEGVVTSACYSPILERTVGLGLLEGGFGRKGETVTVFDEGRTFSARISDPVFYDPAGEKLNA